MGRNSGCKPEAAASTGGTAELLLSDARLVEKSIDCLFIAFVSAWASGYRRIMLPPASAAKGGITIFGLFLPNFIAWPTVLKSTINWRKNFSQKIFHYDFSIFSTDPPKDIK